MKNPKANIIYGFKPKKDVSAIQKYAFKLGDALAKKFDVDFISCNHPESGLMQEFVNFFIYPRIIRKRRKGAINHITSQEYAYLPALMRLDNLIITIHDIFPLTIERYRAKINYRFRIKLGLRAAKKAKRIICDSEYTAKEIIRYANIDSRKIRVVPLGYEEKLYKPSKYDNLFLRYKIPKNKKYILYVGSETDRKNFLNLLKAFHILRDKDKDVILIKVGGSQDKSNHEKALSYIKKNNLQDSVIFAGFVKEEELPQFYSLADVFIFPTLAEGFGFPVLEAMACGCPVICSDKGSLPEVGGKAVLYVDPLNVNAIADRIEMLLNNSKLKSELKKKGLLRAKKFSWKKCAEEVAKVYKEIL